MIGSIRRECVDHIIALGEQHLRKILKSYENYLRDIVFFLFSVPFLLGFAIGHHGEWTAYVAYTVIGVLVLVAAGRIAARRRR